MTDIVEIAKERQARVVTEIAELDTLVWDSLILIATG
jgi:hypothetical protein